eukprot:8159880-Alexandrium_andersonii.AAC.1
MCIRDRPSRAACLPAGTSRNGIPALWTSKAGGPGAGLQGPRGDRSRPAREGRPDTPSPDPAQGSAPPLSLIHISEPTRLALI